MDRDLKELIQAALSNPSFFNAATDDDIKRTLKVIKEFFQTCEKNEKGAIIEPETAEPDYDPSE